MFCYSQSPLQAPIQMSISQLMRMNGTKKYLEHYGNSLTLNFIMANSDKPEERRQARIEMEICESKLTYWRRHPNYDHQEALRGIDKLKRAWNRG